MQCWEEGAGFSTVLQSWTNRCQQIGEHVSIDIGGKVSSGRFVGLAPDGALVLELQDGSREVILAGDVARTKRLGDLKA